MDSITVDLQTVESDIESNVETRLLEDSGDPDETCRYCLSNRKELGDDIILRPCKCNSFICLQCFVLHYNNSNETPKDVCEICKSAYVVPMSLVNFDPKKVNIVTNCCRKNRVVSFFLTYIIIISVLVFAMFGGFLIGRASIISS